VKKPAPWWNYSCIKKLKCKCKVFDLLQKGLASENEYKKASQVCRKVQKKAYAAYQKVLKRRLESTPNSDKYFWSTAKDISGLSHERSSSCPDVDSLADHFAHKMSNGKGVTASADSTAARVTVHEPVVLSGWKVRYKQVLRTLSTLDPSKSSNGVGPRFLRECCKEIAPAVTQLYRYVVQKAVFPASWKIGRITPLHKRNEVSLSENYRPVTVLSNMGAEFEGVLEDQFYLWITKFIPDNQYGFMRDCGTTDYGAALHFRLLSCLEPLL
jgi:hypothetical protein